MFPNAVLLLIFLLALTQAKILNHHEIRVETPSHTKTYHDTKLLDFGEEQLITCICIQGIWALQISDVLLRRQEWEIFGEKENRCFKLGKWVRRLQKLGDDPDNSAVQELAGGSKEKHFVVTGPRNWEVEDSTTNYCLTGAVVGGYCLFSLESSSEIGNKGNPCSEDVIVLEPIKCEAFSRPNPDYFTCDLVLETQSEVILERFKRQDDTGAAGKGTPKPWNFSTVSEDYMDEEERQNFLGNPVMMDAMTHVVVEHVIDAQKLNDPLRFQRDTEETHKFDIPPYHLLKLSVDIFKLFCPHLKSDLIELARDTFIAVQKFFFHVREVAIGYAPFMRIIRALEVCRNKGEPIQFFENKTIHVENDTAICRKTEPPTTSVHMYNPTRIDYMAMKSEKRYGLINNFTKVVHTVEIPPHATSDANLHEPIIEMVWKTFVVAHTACYRYFTSYYNDHNTFTTTMLSFFTNQIQNFWFVNGTNMTTADNSSGFLNYSSSPFKWYGNFLGNVSRLYWDMDHCYSAVKAGFSQYPWFLNRPPMDFTNQWFRRRRETRTE